MWWQESSPANLLPLIKGKEIVLFDTETTGSGPKSDQIIQFAAIAAIFEQDGSLKEIERVDIYIRPLVLIKPKAQEVNGLTREFLNKNGIEESDACEKILTFMQGRIPVGYHSNSFDIPFVSAMAERYGKEWNPDFCLDVYEIVKGVISPDEVDNYKQETIGRYLQVLNDDEKLHNAMNDILLMGRILSALANIIFHIKKNKKEPVRLICPPGYYPGYNTKQERIYFHTDKGEFWYDKYHDLYHTYDYPVEKKFKAENGSVKSKIHYPLDFQKYDVQGLLWELFNENGTCGSKEYFKLLKKQKNFR